MDRKRIIQIIFLIFIIVLNIKNVSAEKIIREYKNEGCNENTNKCITIDMPFVIQYDTDTKKYEFGTILHGYKATSNLEYNGTEYMLGTYEYDGGATTSYSYKMYLNNKEYIVDLKSDESLEIHYCYSKEYGGGEYSNGTQYVAIFYDELQYEKYKDKLDKPMEKCELIKSDAVKNGEQGVKNKKKCITYDSYYDSIENNYKEYNNASKNKMTYIAEANRTIQEMKQVCNSITKYSDYDSNCLPSCLNLNKDIINLKKTYEIGEYKSSGDCSLSGRLISWIANIVKWLKYIVPVIVIIFGILDFMKAMSADKDDEMKKAQSKFVKRLIAAALIFLIPLIIGFILDQFGFDEYIKGCGIVKELD